MKRSKFSALAFSLAAVLGVAACGGSDSATTDTAAPAETAAPEAAADYSSLKVAVVYIGVPGDAGYTYQHDQGIAELEAALGITVTRLENIAEGADSAATFDKLARDGYNLIFGTSFGYMDPMLETAGKYPDVCFEHATGYKTAPNMGTYFGAAEEARYLSGIAAGAASKSGKLGYVAAFPIPEVVRGINAFTLGARSVNPKQLFKSRGHQLGLIQQKKKKQHSHCCKQAPMFLVCTKTQQQLGKQQKKLAQNGSVTTQIQKLETSQTLG